jgi:hypothetical protein
LLPLLAVFSVVLTGGCVSGGQSPGLPSSSRSVSIRTSLPSPSTTRWPPVTLSDCGKAADPGNPDGGVVAGLALPSGDRALRTPTQAYICIGGFTGSVVSVVQSGSPLTVQPARITLPEGGGVLPVTVTATAEGTTTLRLQMVTRTGKPQLLRTVALVVADSERWHFEPAS